jgi:hypothetical protein
MQATDMDFLPGSPISSVSTAGEPSLLVAGGGWNCKEAGAYIVDHEGDPDFEEEQEAMDSSLVDFEFIRYAWLFCLGVAGFLDILATILPPYFYSNPDAKLSGIENAEQNEHILVFVRWLVNNDITINLFFSALWFIDAFFDANVLQNKVLRKKERRRLRVCKGEEPKNTYFWQTANFVYYSSIIFQLVLLPVGFYFTVYYVFNRVVHGKAVEDLNDVREELVVVTTDKEGFAYSEERFSVNTKLTLLFAILQHIWVTTSGTTARLAKAKITVIARRIGPRAIRKLIGSAIKHPFRFRRRMKKMLTAVRWFKYFAPIWGTLNKLKLNVEDMAKKYNQSREAEKQKKARKMLWEKKTPEMREEDAAIILQSTWRSYRARKATNALKLIRGNKEYFAILKVQRVMRRSLARARERLERKRAELERLEMLRKQNASRLSDDEKKRMYELQDELGKEATELLNRKLLLRPNTKFAVVWKILFVVCVSMEITQLALKPLLVPEVHKKGATPFTMENLAAKLFVPTKLSEWPTCHYKKRNPLLERLRHVEEEPLPWYCQGAAATVHGGVRDLVALALIPAPVAEWENCQVKKPSLMDRVLRRRKNESPHHWYCEKPYSAAHGIYRKMVEFFLDEFMLLVSIVCFLDVFVTFFTGDLDPETGSIVPKPFVARWLSPGLLVQLLVNPEMDSLSQFLGQVLDKAFELGPIRVLRWCIAVLFPLVYVSYHYIIKCIWLPVVKLENVYTLKPSNLLVPYSRGHRDAQRITTKAEF